MPFLKNKYHMYHTRYGCHIISHNIKVTNIIRDQCFSTHSIVFSMHSRGPRKVRNKRNKELHVREKLKNSYIEKL